jgi:hypothetical protein
MIAIYFSKNVSLQIPILPTNKNNIEIQNFK